MSRKKIKFLAGSLLIVGAIAYLIGSGVSNTSQYFLTVDELMAKQGSYYGTALKVKGKVAAGSIARSHDDYLNVVFRLEENKADLKVVYKGVTPDLFTDGRDVVVEGTLAQDGVFHANTLLTSCPSKYQADKDKTSPGSGYGANQPPGANGNPPAPPAKV